MPMNMSDSLTTESLGSSSDVVPCVI